MFSFKDWQTLTSIKETLSKPFEAFEKFKDDGGLWTALTGESFVDSFIRWSKQAFETLYNLSDYSIIAIMIMTLISMFGSKKFANYIYWTFAGYIVVKALGGALL